VDLRAVPALDPPRLDGAHDHSHALAVCVYRARCTRNPLRALACVTLEDPFVDTIRAAPSPARGDVRIRSLLAPATVRARRAGQSPPITADLSAAPWSRAAVSWPRHLCTSKGGWAAQGSCRGRLVGGPSCAACRRPATRPVDFARPKPSCPARTAQPYEISMTFRARARAHAAIVGTSCLPSQLARSWLGLPTVQACSARPLPGAARAGPSHRAIACGTTVPCVALPSTRARSPKGMRVGETAWHVPTGAGTEPATRHTLSAGSSATSCRARLIARRLHDATTAIRSCCKVCCMKRASVNRGGC